MKAILRAGVLLCFIGLLPLSAAFAGAPPNVIAENAHTIAGGRAIEVVVGQAEIKSNINLSNVGASENSLLGVLVDSALAKKAEAVITPVRDALSTFDVDSLAETTTKNALAKVDWLKTSTVQFSKDSTPLSKSDFLDTSGAAQVVFFAYSYDLSSDFSRMSVVVQLQFANKAGNSSKPEARLNPKNLACMVSITSVIRLPHPGTNVYANARRWAANDGKLARSGLTQAFANVEKLIPRTLALTDSDVKTMNGKDKSNRVVGGVLGRVQEDNMGDTLLWNDGFIEVELLLSPESPSPW